MPLKPHARTILVSTVTVIAIIVANIMIPILLLPIINALWPQMYPSSVSLLFGYQMLIDLLLGLAAAYLKRWPASAAFISSIFLFYLAATSE
jgi:hypothetical protein